MPRLTSIRLTGVLLSRQLLKEFKQSLISGVIPQHSSGSNRASFSTVYVNGEENELHFASTSTQKLKTAFLK